jgi:hypothetical protein
VKSVPLPASLAPREKPAEWATPAPSLPLQPSPLPLIQREVGENVPVKVSTTEIDCGFKTALFVFIAISQALKLGKLVKFTLRVRVPPGVGTVCSEGTIEIQGTELGGGVGLDGQGPGNGPPP